jgi:hypothetical protein
MTDFKQKLQACRTCEEARPILETLKVRPSARKLVETAIQLKQSKDPRQQSYGLDFMQTAIREIDDDEKTKEANGTAHPMDVGAGAKDIDKKMSEADQITGALDSHQSSDIDMPYPQEGTDEPQSDIESMQTASGENQMGGIKENMAPMPGGQIPGQMPPPPMQQGGGMGQMPPMPGMPPIAPELMKQMAPPQIPGVSPQAMRQMQYTVEANFRRLGIQTINPLIREVKKLREANIALDKKIRELESAKGSMTLDIEKVKANSPVRVRETTMYDNVQFPPPTRFERVALEETRQSMLVLDKELQKAHR